MKNINILLTSTFLAFSVSLYAQIDTISSKTLLLKGKIKKVEDYSFFLDPDPKGTKLLMEKPILFFLMSKIGRLKKMKLNYLKPILLIFLTIQVVTLK